MQPLATVFKTLCWNKRLPEVKVSGASFKCLPLCNNVNKHLSFELKWQFKRFVPIYISKYIITCNTTLREHDSISAMKWLMEDTIGCTYINLYVFSSLSVSPWSLLRDQVCGSGLDRLSANSRTPLSQLWLEGKGGGGGGKESEPLFSLCPFSHFGSLCIRFWLVMWRVGGLEEHRETGATLWGWGWGGDELQNNFELSDMMTRLLMTQARDTWLHAYSLYRWGGWLWKVFCCLLEVNRSQHLVCQAGKKTSF